MIRAFFEVLKDLWDFAFGYSGQNSMRATDTLNLPAPDDKVPSTTGKSLSGVIIPTHKAGQALGRVVYVQSDTATCFNRPELSFDTQLCQLTYGEKVSVNRMKGEFAEIDATKIRGWVESKNLSDDASEVFPALESGVIYGKGDAETIKLRRFLNDETLAGRLALPLQSTEHVLYLLKRFGLKVNWPLTRPRVPGTWQKILRGVKGVSMSIEPRTAAIFEYVGDEGVPGFLGYIEAVHPDQSITLQSVGRKNEGEYLVEEFTNQEWKEWRPTFITFT